MAVGVAITVAPVSTFKPVLGAHEYETPPVAVNTAVEPAQIAPEHDTCITGKVSTVTVTLAVPVQPYIFLPVTV